METPSRRTPAPTAHSDYANYKADDCRPRRKEEQEPRPNWVWIRIWPKPYCGEQDDCQKRPPAKNNQSKADHYPFVSQIFAHPMGLVGAYT